jgi:hypothetical protein
MNQGEHIHVSLRFRPPNQREVDERDVQIWTTFKNSVGLKPEFAEKMLDEKRGNKNLKTYTYNKVYTAKHTNKEIYKGSVRSTIM